MIQLKVYDGPAKANQSYIDLYDESPIKLNFSIEDITNTEAKSVYSRTFRVPGTAQNNKFFKWAFMVEDTDFDVTVKIPAELYVNGNIFRSGQIRLQKIYRNKVQDRYEYELLFLGETRDFASSLGSASLCDLDLSHLGHRFDDTNVVTSWSAFPSTKNYLGVTITPSFTNGLLNGDVVYPLIDFGNVGTIDGDNPRIGLDNDFNFTNHNLPLTRLKPVVRAKAIIDAIFDATEYTYAPGGFFDSDTFKQLYVSGWGNQPSVTIDVGGTSNTFRAEGYNTQDIMDILICDVEISDPGNNYNPDQNFCEYTIPGSGTSTPEAGEYTFNAGAYIAVTPDSSGGSPEARLELQYRIASGLWTTFAVSGYTSANFREVTGTITFTEAQLTSNVVKVRCYVAPSPGAIWDRAGVSEKHFQCISAPGDIDVSAQFDCDYKQIDFVKDLLTTFRLVMSPNIENPTEFFIEPWIDYVATGNYHDWSQKLDQSKDVVLEPLFDTQTDIIEFKHTEDKDTINQYHVDQYKNVYGYLKFDSQNDLLTGTRTIQTNWAPTPIQTIEGADETKPDELGFILPIVHTHGTSDEHAPIKPKTRLLFYNGLIDIDQTHNISWRLANDEDNGNAPGSPYQFYPLVSNSSTWPMTPGGIVLNWFNDIGYWSNQVTGTYPKQVGNSLYNQYWSSYIQSLYNSSARRFSGKFILDDQDLRDFSFDDVIFVNGHYYRPEKISNAAIGEKSAVEVQLIKLLNYRP